MLRTIEGIQKKILKPLKQPEIPITQLKKAPKIYQEDREIIWNQNAEKIINFIRGLAPYPAASTIWQGTSFKILAAIISDSSDLSPGKWQSNGKTYLYIGTKTQNIAITYLQMAGKRPMDILTFLRGNTIT